ncbi:SLC13 family permease [Thermodesulfatator atlanticus]
MAFILKEWLFFSSLTALIFSSIYLKKFPSYSLHEIKVIFILFILFVIVKGLERSKILHALASRIEKGKYIPLKLILTTFFLSMIVTNDVTLLIIVPLTLALEIENKASIVILEALAVNAGSALTLIGNPQNLFIYWHYHLNFLAFIKAIFPFCCFFLFLLIIISSFLSQKRINKVRYIKIERNYILYLLFLLIFVPVALGFLPIYLSFFILFYVLLKDRKTLMVDYSLLFTFFFLFGFSENLKEIFFQNLKHTEHVFLTGAVLSQFISNVPAALILAKLTTQWKALLWGVSVGGYGNLMGSLANIIAYRLYVRQNTSSDHNRFLLLFTGFGYLFFMLGIGLYFLCQGL